MRQVRQRLAQQSILVMDYGGRFVEASARTSLLLVAVLLHSIASALVAMDRYLERERKLNDKARALRGRTLRAELAKSSRMEPKPLQPVTPSSRHVIATEQETPQPQGELPKPRIVPKPATSPRKKSLDQAQTETTAVLNRLSKLMAGMSVPDDRVRVFVISSELQDSIRSAAESLGLPETIVQSLHPWILELSGQWNLTIHHKAKDEYQALQSILRYVEKNRPTPVLEVAIIEDRDLLPEAYRLLSLLSKHVTLFADDGRRIHDCF